MRSASIAMVFIVAWAYLIGGGSTMKLEVEIKPVPDVEPGPDCNPRGCICTTDYDPVCGSDGKTYGNMCELKCAAKCDSEITMVSKGECQKGPDCDPRGCPCPKIYKPVCGSDGKTHGNMCLLECAAKCDSDITMVSKGECQKGGELPEWCQEIRINCKKESKNHPCCPEIEEPKPGNANEMATEDNIDLKDDMKPNMEGRGYKSFDTGAGPEMEEPKPDGGPGIEEPKPDGGPGMEGEDNTEPKPDGGPGMEGPDCDALKVCPCPRKKIYRPVCGSDGKTYSNKCLLKCAAKCDSEITMVSEGECQKGPECNPLDCICPLIYDPVCGSDGKTYSNKCGLKCAAKCDSEITMVSKGKCQKEVTTEKQTESSVRPKPGHCFPHQDCKPGDCCAAGSSCLTCPFGHSESNHDCAWKGNFQCNWDEDGKKTKGYRQVWMGQKS